MGTATATHRRPVRRLANAEPRFYLLPRDGWLTLILTVLIIYITIVSVQAVQPPWAYGLQVLTPAMALGILLGYLATQQTFIPSGRLHLLATVIGMTGAFFMTAQVALDGNWRRLAQNTAVWFSRALTPNGTSADNSVFLLFLATLTFLLAYMTMWLVFHARRPWLAVVANAVVLLINIDQSSNNEFYFLIVFLVLTLLLLVRFTLAENVRHWRRTGLRFSPDLGWDFMQAGAIFSVIVALLPNLLPIAQPDQAWVNYWNSSSSPVNTMSQRVQDLFSGVNGSGPGGVSFFSPNLTLVGNVNLPETQILHYTVDNPLQNDPTQYLVTETFSNYDGLSEWSRGQTSDQNYSANQPQIGSTDVYRPDVYHITFDVVPAGGEKYILAPGSSAESFSIPSTSQMSVNTGEPLTWLAQSGLSAGHGYVAMGYVSSATVDQLSAVPYPSDAQASGQTNYPQAIIDTYKPADEVINPVITKTAENIARGTPNMYQAAVALQDYLRTFTYSAHNPNPPSGEDATVWFLNRREGFCTFFASAMALMGRSLGMPTRIVSGYSAGSYDEKTHAYIIRGSQAHTWTQVYFAQYGWINFEPTASFTPFYRPTNASTGPVAGGTVNPGVSKTTTAHDNRIHDSGNGGVASSQPQDNAWVRAGLVTFLVLLIALLILGALWLWWRSLFRTFTPAASSFARLILLGIWAGAPPQPSQTPHQYARHLAAIAPEQRAAIEQVSALYARERWGEPLNAEEDRNLPALYERGQSGLVAAILRRLRQFPGQVANVLLRARNEVRARLRY